MMVVKLNETSLLEQATGVTPITAGARANILCVLHQSSDGIDSFVEQRHVTSETLMLGIIRALKSVSMPVYTYEYEHS